MLRYIVISVDEMTSKALDGVPLVLSTPETHILEETNSPDNHLQNRTPEQEIHVKYEIQRTLDEIHRHWWRRVALQFPDDMLPDSARVFQHLARGLQNAGSVRGEDDEERTGAATGHVELAAASAESSVKLTILADTSYGSCCVDEIAAEHVEAEAVIHYGRACLSPTARLPVVHIFTKQALDCEKVALSFQEAFPDKATKIILTADVPFAHHVQPIYGDLLGKGYERIFAAEVMHDPSSPIPNRSVPGEARVSTDNLKHWHLFHISDPPSSLLLTLSSRLSEIRIYPTDGRDQEGSIVRALTADTSLILRRRYGLVTSLATVTTWGILINTLSVKNYLHIVDHVKSQITAAGKKSYLFVVGKLNAAKVANFSEIGGWVVIGCWESSLVNTKEFYKPVITPFELELALRRDDERIWTGKWSADFQRILDANESTEPSSVESTIPEERNESYDGDDVDEESAPPAFDLRTGRYVSQSQPMRAGSTSALESLDSDNRQKPSALARRGFGDVLAIDGIPSPAAQFLQSGRTWTGLGSDFEIGYEDEAATEGGVVQEGRSGIARGYVVGSQGSRT